MNTTRISRSAKLAGASAAILGLTFGGAATAVWAQGDTAPTTDDRATTAVVTPGLVKVDSAFEIDLDDETWAPFEACLDAAIGDEPTDAEWEAMTQAEADALDEKFDAAEAECVALLPEAEQAEVAKWEAFDDCMDENLKGFEDLEDGDMVFVETADGEELVVLNGEGSVTVTRDAAGAVTVDTTGAVELFDESAMDAVFDAAEAACGDLAPEGWSEMDGDDADFFDGFDIDEMDRDESDDD